MKKILYCFILGTISVFFWAPKASAQTDFEKIITNVNTEIKKGYSSSTPAINSGITTLMTKMNTNGSWNDLSYTTGVVGDVPFNTHLSRLRTMAVAYTYPGATYFGDVALYNKIVSGLQYWNANIHDAFNWYNDQISYPQLLGEMLIEMRGGIALLPSVDETAAIIYLSSRDNPSTQTGANRVDESVHWVFTGALTSNATRVTTGVTQAQSTLTLVNSGSEGINSDFAFLQHESQLMIQGYGHDFLDGIYNVAVYIVGTSFGFTTAQLQNAYLFLHNSYVGAARGPYKDFNLDGRGISRVNSNKGINAKIIAKAMAVDPVHAAALRSDSLRVTQVQGPSYNVTQPYHIHFWTGDYTLHNRPRYSFGVRSVSTRTVRTETMNGENLLGTWLSDGATSIRVDGNEYNNIFPVWDWNKIPGITMREFSTPVPNPNRFVSQSYGNTSFVGGVSDSSYGASTYKQNNGGVTATKSWFFFDNEIVCLGAGITSVATENVATTINQALLSGTVSVKAGGVTSTLAGSSQQSFTGNLNWILHNKVGYFFPSAGDATVSNQTQSGSWSAIGTGSTSPVSLDVFKLWFSHGAQPSNAGYNYIVAPGITTTAQMDAYNSAAIQILSNTAAIQAVKHTGLNIVQVIFSAAGTLAIPGSELNSITVDKPCALIIKNANTTNPIISIADPAQQNSLINVLLTFQTASQKSIAATMPSGNYKGSSKTLSANGSTTLFTPGVLAVLRIGGINGTNGNPGTTTPGTSGSPVHIDKYTVTAPGTITNQSSIDLPVSGTNKIFNSSSLNEGYITQSGNKQWLSVMGYATTATSGTIYSTTANPNIARVLGLVKHDGTVDLTTALSNFPVNGTAATAQTSITNNGTDLWAVTNQGNGMGIIYTNPGATDATTAPSVIVSPTISSTKSLAIFGGDLYYVASSGTRIGKVSATGGLPTTAGNTMTPLPVATGSTAYTTFAPSQMVMFDMDSSVLGYDVLYVTNASTTTTLAGIYKYCKNAFGQWVSYGTFGSIATDGAYFGITGGIVDGLPVMYVTRGITTTTTVSTNQLIQLAESSGYNANMNAAITATTDATVSGKNGTIRGVAFYPTPSFYYKGAGNLNDLSSWGANIDGSGTAPANFTDADQTFFITNGTSATLSGNWTVSGSNSKIILGDGTNATSLTIPAAFSISAEMDVYKNAVLDIQNVQIPSLHYIAQNSTIYYAANASQAIRTMAYGNLNNSSNNTASINGTVTVEGTMVQNGILKGNATLIVPNGLYNTGTLAPGNSAGLFVVTGNFTNNASGKLAIELGGITTPGVDYDQLTVGGTATIAGTLYIETANSFVPQAGQTFTIITANTVSGAFTTINWPSGVSGTVNYTGTTVELNITSVTLPLHLVNFTGSVLQTGKHLLQWKTADENNVDLFEVERSENGNDFSLLTRHRAVGVGDNNYQVLDENPLGGFNYYRVKTVDKDARFVYTNTIRLKHATKSVFSLFPNPAKNNLVVTHPMGSQQSTIQLMQADGKVVYKQKIPAGAIQSSLDISAFTPGAYIVVISSASETKSIKLVKE